MITAIIPARSGSKRLPGKNIRLLAGKPLFVWTLEACVKANGIDKVLFSTDSHEYWELAQQHLPSQKLALDYRSPDEAGDKVKIFDYLVDSCDKLFGQEKGKFMLCLPTMPLRTDAHIAEAIDLSVRNDRAVFSAVEYDFATSFGFTISEQGEWEPLFASSPMLTGNTRSQDQVKAYHPNGAIYLRSIDDLRSGTLKTLYQCALPYVMDKFLSVDIDTEEDFKLAEFKLSRQIDRHAVL